MNACPHCAADNPPTHRFCQRCGRSFDPGLTPSDVTTPISGAGSGDRRIPVDVFTSSKGEPHRVIAVQELFAFKDRLVIGREPSCDICLPHTSVSRKHALLERLPQGLRLRDLRSANGVLVGGRRLTEPIFLAEQVRVGIGPYLFCLSGNLIHALDSSQSLRLEARHLEKVVSLGGGRTRKLLDDINLAVEPGEFVTLLGPSGSGKSTLMDCLNGRRPATRGRVLANGEDFYLHFDNFRQSLGYVPQKDIVHTQLTVRRALYYTARLRLPRDTRSAEVNGRLDEVIRLMELGPHQDTLVGDLSGGQIKRVSLGAELLARPCMLYIDEATSGLDAGTEARIMQLFRQLADEGKSVLCITHNVDSVSLCDLIIVLMAGRLVYYGPPAESHSYFGVAHINAIYGRLAEKTPPEWEKDFTACSLYREYVADRLASAPAGSIMRPDLAAPAPAPAAVPRSTERPQRQLLHQFRVLTARYLELIWHDKRTLRLLFLQGPLLSLVILLGFINKPYQNEILSVRRLTTAERATLERWTDRLRKSEPRQTKMTEARALLVHDPAEAEELQALLVRLQYTDDNVPGFMDRADMVLQAQGPIIPERFIKNPSYTYILLFLLVITILWFGCNNAAKEIVREEAIYSRERAVNLGIVPYLGSKFLVLSMISALQVFIIMALVYGTLELLHATLGHDVPEPEYRLNYLAQYGVLVLLSMTGVALGLCLSACVNSPERAAILLPYVLIPQIILGGGILLVEDEPLHTLAVIASPAYWAYRAIRLGETTLPPDFPWRVNYNDNEWIACAALTAQMVGLLLLTAWFLRRKDALKG